MKLLYRPEEAADVLGLSRSRVYELLASGDLVGVKDGRRRLIPAESLEAYARRLIGTPA